MAEKQLDLQTEWRTFCDRLAGAGEVVLDPAQPGDDADRVEGFRHVLRSLYRAIGSGIEGGDVDFPELAWVHPSKSGQDNPDAIYQAARVDLTNTYRLTGNLGSVRYVGITLMTFDFGKAPIEQLLTVNTEALPCDSAGNIDIVFSPESPPPDRLEGTWFTLPSKACRFFVRQFFSDWETEEPARLRLERVGATNPVSRMSSDLLVKHLHGITREAVELTAFWRDFGRTHLDAGQVNSFAHIEDDRKPDLTMGASPEQVYGQCWWRLQPSQALIYEVEVPECVYWGVQLGDIWFQSLDWVNRQSSLNDHQAIVDPDGVFRAVICEPDPGIANWLDTTGATQGCVTYRWNQGDRSPVPTLSLVEFDDLDGYLPTFTTRVDAEERTETLRNRRQSALRRFLR
ncbi:MAG: hypothetical protein VX833_05915 [Actinomycetota bacterium]|nr:hypothetical protein [Actinomycetota bacterium]